MLLCRSTSMDAPGNGSVATVFSFKLLLSMFSSLTLRRRGGSRAACRDFFNEVVMDALACMDTDTMAEIFGIVTVVGGSTAAFEGLEMPPREQIKPVVRGETGQPYNMHRVMILTSSAVNPRRH